GQFILEPLEEQPSSLQLRARVQYMTRHFENPRELEIDVDIASIEIRPLKNNERLVDSESSSPIMDGHIITFKTSDPVKAPLPHRDLMMLQCLLIRVLRIASRGGQDMLQIFNSDDDISSLTSITVRETSQSHHMEPSRDITPTSDQSSPRYMSQLPRNFCHLCDDYVVLMHQDSAGDNRVLDKTKQSFGSNQPAVILKASVGRNLAALKHKLSKVSSSTRFALHLSTSRLPGLRVKKFLLRFDI
ncbi:hypothetical protein MMC31_006971, partial [Peltigera leucophlebia]|nr:hypothetical protein [Peltigera leucophlebia]